MLSDILLAIKFKIQASKIEVYCICFLFAGHGRWD
jgi:hypothetical protein